MPDIRDAADAVLLGLFLFGLVLTVATLLLGVADLGAHHADAHDGGPLHVSLGAVLVFLTWLGGAGYIARRAADLPLPVALPAAAILGVGVAYVVQRIAVKLNDPTGSVLNPEEYRLPGTIGRVSSSIRAGGIGEVVYEQGGARHVVGARASEDQALPQGAEIVILRIDRGIATVEAFDPFWSLEHDRDAGSARAVSDSQKE
jgi:membrane protein implicated in regulation of membrane protease activity